MTPPAETIEQVREWERAKSRYLANGLCHRCAAQAAWAHQNHGDSWLTIHPPCDSCAPIVAGFPWPTPRIEWRKTLRPNNRTPAPSQPHSRATSGRAIRAGDR